MRVCQADSTVSRPKFHKIYKILPFHCPAAGRAQPFVSWYDKVQRIAGLGHVHIGIGHLAHDDGFRNEHLAL